MPGRGKHVRLKGSDQKGRDQKKRALQQSRAQERQQKTIDVDESEYVPEPSSDFEEFPDKDDTNEDDMSEDDLDEMMADGDKEDLLNDDDIFKGFNLSKEEFYVSTFIQSLTNRYFKHWTRESDSLHSVGLSSQVLDLLALLFARAKKLGPGKQVVDRFLCPSSGGQNVTAATWGARDSANKLRTIYVVKNGGPQNFDGIHDETFASRFASWYNALDKDAEPKPPTAEDEQWKFMQEFWFHRHRFYVHELMSIRERWKKLCIVEDSDAEVSLDNQKREIFVMRGADGRRGAKAYKKCGILLGQDYDLPQPIAEALEDEGAEDLVEGFESDWHHLARLMSFLDEDCDAVLNNKDELAKFVNHVCLEDDGIWQLTYQRRPRSEKRDLTKPPTQIDDIHRLIKCFRMLRIVYRVWQGFTMYRVRDKTDIEIIFQPKLSVAPIPAQNFQEVFEKLQSKGHDKEVLQKLQKHLKYKGKVRRNFHCELQLICIPQEEEKSADMFRRTRYIGCSKLSCILCWQMLQHFGYATRNTHGKIEAGCAFPLQLWNAAYRHEGETKLGRLAEEIVIPIFHPGGPHADETVDTRDSASDTDPGSEIM